MVVQTKVDMSLNVLDGKGTYCHDEFAIDYQTDSKYNIKNGTSLIIFHTLTICFDKIEKSFLSLDDYTNIDQWKYNSEIECSFLSSGILKIVEPENESNRYFIDFEPTYEYSQNAIKITLSDYLDCNYFKVSSNLIVGLRNGVITSFIILNPILD